MSSAAVIYQSKYGSAKQYAEWIAQALDAPLFERGRVKPPQLLDYDLVIYGGGVYAGSIAGVDLVAKNPCKNLILFTVGLFDPQTADYTDLLKALPAEKRQTAKVFHLRGGLDRQKLGLVHKGIMAVVKKTLAKKDPSLLSNEDKAMLESLGGKVDYTDKDSIAPLVAFAREQLAQI